MFYKNARIFTTNNTFITGAFEITPDGTFGAVLPAAVPADAVDLHGATVIPGLVDIHIHGAMGADFSDGDPSGLETMARYLAKNGITAFAPASMTLPYDTLSRAFATGADLAARRPADCARYLGAHMEGPYFSEKKKGAQNGAYLKTPDFEGFSKLYNDCGGTIAIVDVAPELPGAEDFVRQAREKCTVSVAHTDATYDQTRAVYDAGASGLTHLYNAMPGIHHRNPGVIPAAVETPSVYAELICDGLHVHPASVRLAYAMFGPERLVLVSDALRCCGMPDGRYELGGQTVTLADGIARLSDGTIAGSATNLFECMRRAMAFGIPEAVAVRAATANPARAARAEYTAGAIRPGASADFVICTDNYQTIRPFLSGREIL